VATDTGEIAAAVLVPSTKTTDYSHAAIQLVTCNNFKPTAWYSDTWPCKDTYWSLLLPNLQGRLGLFHYQQRIVKTLRKRHIDYYRALNQLLDAIYFYNDEDYEKLLLVLKDGRLSGRKYSDTEISSLKMSKAFRQRYGKYLRKQIRAPESMRQRLDDWFATFKCSASDGAREALGRRDPITNETLFTADTKDAVENCKEKVIYLQDPLPLDQMYYVIKPNPNSSHGLSEYLSRRGESNLESFHELLAHFGNNGMRDSLADNLNLTGTARHNLRIRHKLRLLNCDNDQRKKIPAAWESYFNHSELHYVNNLAKLAGINDNKFPFPYVEPLVNDTGERFFAKYLDWLLKANPKFDQNDLCLCISCSPNQPATLPMVHKDPLPNNAYARQHDPTNSEQSNVTNSPLSRPVGSPEEVNHKKQQPQQPQLIPPFFPSLFFNPFLTSMINYNTGFCCLKYQEYCGREDHRGRPPHDHWCAFKTKKL
jgi:hypothetical protein